LYRSVNVVVLTYNNRELLIDCVSSIRTALANAKIEGTITVVDNNSDDGTADAIPEKFPSVRYLRNGENAGTARGFNRGIREGMNDAFTMLMNDDTELFPDTLYLMLNALRTHPEAGGVAAHPVYPDGRSQRVKLKVFGGLKRIKDDRVRVAEFSGTTACLYRTAVFEKVGLFDEFYFFYNEDLDFAVRAKRKGIRFVFDPKIKVKHRLHQGRSKGARFVRPHFYAANWYFYRKNYGGAAALLYRIFASLAIARLLNKPDANRDGRHEYLMEGRRQLRSAVCRYREIRLKGEIPGAGRRSG
jgi:GT2 family glycosyltransferase